MSIFLGYLACRKGFAFKCFSLLLRSLQMAMDICNYLSLTQLQEVGEVVFEYKYFSISFVVFYFFIPPIVVGFYGA